MNPVQSLSLAAKVRSWAGLSLCSLLILSADIPSNAAAPAPPSPSGGGDPAATQAALDPKGRSQIDAGPELVSFPSDGLTLQGFLWKPAGAGPFPGVLYNHGSEKNPSSFPTLARFYTSHDYVFFVPHRHGHGRSPGDYIVDLEQQYRSEQKDPALVQRHSVELHERYNRDVVNALEWLKQQPFVQTNRLCMSGASYGGIQTLLTAEQGHGVKAFVPFAPAAMSWRGNPQLRERLLRAVRAASAPIFLLQATNDYNLGPSLVLGPELQRKGAPNRAQVYPAFGDPKNPQEGHGGFAVRGSAVWGSDVLSFLAGVLPK